MEHGMSCLSCGERERRRHKGLCFFCGSNQHQELQCNECFVQVTADKVFALSAMISSGSAGNFMDRYAHSTTQLWHISAIDGAPNGSRSITHISTYSTYQLSSQGGTITLGHRISCTPNHPRNSMVMSWNSPKYSNGPNTAMHIAFFSLTYNPMPLQWKVQRLMLRFTFHWNSRITQKYSAKPKLRDYLHTDLTTAPSNYYQALRYLSSHLSTISQGTSSSGKISEAQQGYIVPSTSLASASFFFMKKKDVGLRPRIDYHDLNNVIVRYPSHPSPTRSPEPRVTTVSTNIHQTRPTYYLVRIREDDECKAVFSMGSVPMA